MSYKVHKLAARLNKKSSRLARLMGLWIGVPIVLAVIYYGMIASNYYQSESQFTIQSADRRGAASLNMLFGGILGGAGADNSSLLVQNYILSRDVLRRLDREHGFISHYQGKDTDWISRLARDASLEESYDYYLTMVDVTYDSQSGISTLKVKALGTEKAAEFANAILGYSEEFVNGLSRRIERDYLEFANREVEVNEQRLREVRTDILQLQSNGKEINPTGSAAALMEIRTQLEGELARAQAELSRLRSYMRTNAPQVISLRQKISSLKKQIENENQRLVEPGQQSLSASIARFEPLIMEKEFSRKAYESALVSLETARMEAAQQHRYLATIVSPSRPDEATHPKRIMNIITVLFFSLAGFGIGSLLVAAVREHARI